jgi:hypothetical protein
MDNAESQRPPLPRRASRRRRWAKVKDWALIGVALLTFGTVIDNNLNVRKLSPQRPPVEAPQKSGRSPLRISNELKSIPERYQSGKLDDVALITLLDQIRVDQNWLVANNCSLERRNDLEALKTDMEAAEAYSRLRREFPHATTSRKRELLEMVLTAMDQRNGMIQNSCASVWLRKKVRGLRNEISAA